MPEPHVQQKLVFGRDRDVGVAEEVVGRAGGASSVRASNPCVVAFGPGPADRNCSSCMHLVAQGGVAGRYLKCDLRRITGGSATDHRARWPACARYEERT